MMNGIYLLPIGTIDMNIQTYIRGMLEEIFNSPAEIGVSVTVPAETYNASRRQYHSTHILSKIIFLKPERFSHLLGIIDEDIFIPELNFVFGVADMIGDAAIISLSRLRQEFYGLSPDRDLFLMRAAKEAIHEIGHTCGLVHCTDPLCIMYFSNSLVDTDKKGPDFCSYCRKRLFRTIRSFEKEPG